MGKRRGGKSLPVGVVKKQKKPEEEDETVSFHQTKFVVINTYRFYYFFIQHGKTDAWSQYMSEVKKYKERLGDEEEKNRPLVK